MSDSGDYLRTAADETACIVMIETAAGLANVAAIAATDGVDALFIGPFDLCLAIGLEPGDFTSPKFEAALAKILTACRESGKAAGIFGYTAEIAAKHLAGGFVFASVGTDISFLRTAGAVALAVARA